MRRGSGRRAMASKAKSFTMSPKYDGSSRPSRFSKGDDRGLANCPAIRPTFTVGTPVLYINTTDICRITLSLSRMLSAVNSANDSAQSPAWSRKPSPLLTAASDSRNERASPANTSGGMRRSSSVTSSSSAVSGHSGWCAAGRRRQLDGQLGVTRHFRRERPRHVRELLAQVGGQDLLELVDGALVDLLERPATRVVERCPACLIEQCAHHRRDPDELGRARDLFFA